MHTHTQQTDRQTADNRQTNKHRQTHDDVNVAFVAAAVVAAIAVVVVVVVYTLREPEHRNETMHGTECCSFLVLLLACGPQQRHFSNSAQTNFEVRAD